MMRRLLDSIYNAFDKDPMAVPVLRLSHADGIAWSIKQRVLTVETAAGGWLGTYALLDYTIETLAAALVVDGIGVDLINPDKQAYSSSILIEQKPGNAIGNLDILWAYDSLLWSLLDMYARELELTDAQITEATKQIVYTTADGEFLDVWGNYIGILRNLGEHDADYRTRTFDIITREKSNALALVENIKDLLGETVQIRETWQEIFTLSESPLSGANPLQGAPIYEYHVCQLIADHAIDWAAAMAIIEADRPTGTLFLPPQMRLPAFFDDISGTLELIVSFSRTTLHTAYIQSIRGQMLSDNLALSDDAPIDQSYPLLYASTRSQNPDYWTQTWNARTWRKG